MRESRQARGEFEREEDQKKKRQDPNPERENEDSPELWKIHAAICFKTAIRYDRYDTIMIDGEQEPENDTR